MYFLKIMIHSHTNMHPSLLFLQNLYLVIFSSFNKCNCKYKIDKVFMKDNNMLNNDSINIKNWKGTIFVTDKITGEIKFVH